MEYFTAREISEAVGLSKRAITLRANKENWDFIKIEGRGGLIPHYVTEKLPADIKSSLRAMYGEIDDVEKRANHAAEFHREVAKRKSEQEIQLKRDALLKEPLNLEGNKRATTALCILKLAQASIDESIGKTASWTSFVESYNSRELEIEESHYQVKSHLSIRTLIRWEKAYAEKGIAGLTPRYGTSKGKGIIDRCPEMQRFCIALIHEFPHVKGERLAELLAEAGAHLSAGELEAARAEFIRAIELDPTHDLARVEPSHPKTVMVNRRRAPPRQRDELRPIPNSQHGNRRRRPVGFGPLGRDQRQAQHPLIKLN